MFSGSFTQISFGEVLRLLTAAAQNGELQISSREYVIGSVFLVNGQIADAKTSSFNSLDAISELCSYTDANFTFNQGVTSASQPLQGIPTAKIIETIIGRVNQISLIRSFAPLPNEIVIYKPGEKISQMDASPDEISLLLLSNGMRSVEQISLESGKPIDFVQQSFARFRQVGLIEIVTVSLPPTPPSPQSFIPPAQASQLPSPAASPESSANASSTSNQPRFWRGKRID